jgi:hypothetical protein
VVFRIIVEEMLRFDSGVMRSGEPPKSVHIPLAGAQEVRLEAKDAGDKTGRLSRALDGGWLPIPLITAAHDGVTYHELSFVAPCDEPGSDARRFNRLCACVVEFTMTNTGETHAQCAGLAREQRTGIARPARSAAGFNPCPPA